MLFSALTIATTLAGVANAHFRLLHPLPRGLVVTDNEPNFCGGYAEVTTNRTIFPLEDGYINIKTGHGHWVVGVTISTVDNPNNFDNFTVNNTGEAQLLVRDFASEELPGEFCLPLNISAAGIPGVGEGSNVTIQVVFNGGDGNLYQCADLTLSKGVVAPADTCTNVTTTDGHDNNNGTNNNSTDSGGNSAATGLVYSNIPLALSIGLLGVISTVL